MTPAEQGRTGCAECERKDREIERLRANAECVIREAQAAERFAGRAVLVARAALAEQP